jgi:hypothetical protein
MSATYPKSNQTTTSVTRILASNFYFDAGAPKDRRRRAARRRFRSREAIGADMIPNSAQHAVEPTGVIRVSEN